MDLSGVKHTSVNFTSLWIQEMFEVHFGTLTVIKVPSYNFSKPPPCSDWTAHKLSSLAYQYPEIIIVDWSFNQFNWNWANPTICTHKRTHTPLKNIHTQTHTYPLKQKHPHANAHILVQIQACTHTRQYHLHWIGLEQTWVGQFKTNI